MRKTTLTLIPSFSLLAVSMASIPAQDNTPPLSLTLILLGLCCFFSLFIGVFVLGFIVRRGDQKEKKEN
jgi:hypothetical protein